MAEKRYTALFEAKDRVSPAVRAMTTNIVRARDEKGRFIKTVAEMDRQQDRYNRTTRETTGNLDRMRRALYSVGSGFSTLGGRGMTAVRTLSGGIAGIVSSIMSLPALIAGAGAAFGAWKLGDAVIGGGLRQEMTLTQLQGLAGSDQKGNSIYAMLREQAANSTFSTQDYTQATRSYLGFSKDQGQLSEMLDVTKKLALLDPIQGFDGASFALKEAMSGDLLSLSERFELPKSFLRNNGFDSGGDYLSNLKAVEKTLNQMGMDDKAVTKFESTGMAQLTEFKNKSLDWLGQMGSGVVKEMKPFFSEVNKFFKSSDAKNFSRDMSASLGSAFNSAITYIGDMNLKWSDFERILSGAGDIFSGVGDSFAIMMGTFTGEKKNSPREQFESFAKSIEDAGTAIATFNKSFAPFMDGVRSFTEWGTQYFGEDESGRSKKGLVEKGADWLSGKSFFESDPWKGGEGQTNGFFKQLGPLYQIIDSLNFNPNAGSSGRLRGSHRAGLSYVPYDGYIAELHKGEQVVPAQAAGRMNGQVLVTGNTFHVRQESDIDAIGKAIANELRLKGAI